MAILFRKETTPELEIKLKKLRSMRMREEERAKLRTSIAAERAKIKTAKKTSTKSFRKIIGSYASSARSAARKMQSKQKKKKSIWEI